MPSTSASSRRLISAGLNGRSRRTMKSTFQPARDIDHVEHAPPGQRQLAVAQVERLRIERAKKSGELIGLWVDHDVDVLSSPRLPVEGGRQRAHHHACRGCRLHRALQPPFRGGLAASRPGGRAIHQRGGTPARPSRRDGLELLGHLDGDREALATGEPAIDRQLRRSGCRCRVDAVHASEPTRQTRGATDHPPGTWKQTLVRPPRPAMR